MKLFFAFTIFTVASLAQGHMREVDPEQPYLTELGQFAARQMSTKVQLLKLMQVQHAEQDDALYKLKLTLQRNGNKNDIMYCTVEIQAGKPELDLQNYGCTLPALVRRRRPNVAKAIATTESPMTTEAPVVHEVPSTAAPSSDEYDILSYPYEKNVNTVKTKVVGDDESSLNEIDSEPTRKPKRHVVYVRQPIRAVIPSRSLFYGGSYQSRPLYQVASQPIVYRLQPQYHNHYQPYYQPRYQPYYRTIAY